MPTSKGQAGASGEPKLHEKEVTSSSHGETEVDAHTTRWIANATTPSTLIIFTNQMKTERCI